MNPVEVATLTTPRQRGITNGVFYLAGASVCVFAMFDPLASRPGLATVGLLAATVGVGSIMFRDRWSALLTHTAVALASLLVAVAAAFAGGGIGSVLLFIDYVLVLVFVALLGSSRAVLGHAAWAATCLLVVSLALWSPLMALAIAATFVTVTGTITAVAGLLARQLRRSASTDPLTGVANRVGFDAALCAAMATVERTGEPLTLLLLDLDDFKAVNDRDGHAAGDDLLRRATVAWGRHVRARDTLARLGGDEFAVVMPGADLGAAEMVGRRLAQETPQIGCSVGLASWSPGMGRDALMALADARLYDDKTAHEDGVVAAREHPLPAPGHARTG